MTIVGEAERECDVQSIDVWFSQRRQAWIVERTDIEGNQIGAAHVCPQEADIAACLDEWLRSHATVQFVTPYGPSGGSVAARRRDLRRRAA